MTDNIIIDVLLIPILAVVFYFIITILVMGFISLVVWDPIGLVTYIQFWRTTDSQSELIFRIVAWIISIGVSLSIFSEEYL
jgi:hypothetical protein